MEQQFQHQDEEPRHAIVTEAEHNGESNIQQQQSDRTVRDVQAWLEYVGQAHRKKFDMTTWLTLALLIAPLWLLSQLWSDFHWNPNEQSAVFSIVSFIVIPLALLFKLNRAQSSQEEMRQDFALGQPDIRWVGPLAEGLIAPNARIRSASARMLTRLLPRLQPEDAALLTPFQRYGLQFRLRANAPRDTELVLATLKALERIGSAEDLSYVESLADQSGWLPRQKAVREAAFACLSAIEARLEQKEDSTASDRSSSETQTPSETRQAQSEVESQLSLLEKQRRTHNQPAMRIAFLIASWCSIVPYTAWQTLDSASAGERVQAVIWGALFVLSTQLHRFSLSSKQKEAAQQLAAYNNVNGVGPLAEALEWPDPEIQKVAAAALIKLLPQLHATDSGLLNANQRGCLYRRLTMLNAGRDRELICAILKALEQVGDEAAVPYVRRLAKSSVITKTQWHIRRAAEECLPYLIERADQNRVSQMLLRPSGLETAGSEALLRPAEEASIHDPEQLLRAGTSTVKPSF